ncbi:hypothetical protein, partial [Bacteroides sp.]|uniref:hypothetical protein n=1 Tax=Bacteroides sp. TaxID=29523 RepID=UPI002FC9BC80
LKRQPIFPEKCTGNSSDSSFFQKNALETQATAHFSRKMHWKLNRQLIFPEKCTGNSSDSPFFQKNALSTQSIAHFSGKTPYRRNRQVKCIEITVILW